MTKWAAAVAAGALAGWAAGWALAAEARQAGFERLFGESARLDPAMIAKAKAAKAGTKVLVDRNADGKNDEAWFIDTQLRHTKDAQPLLVRAIDEDGDLDAWKGPDLDSDLYLADWKADGVVDSVIDYQDNDKDGDVDEMCVYYWLPNHAVFGKDVIGAWWSRDDGDDNLLWFDVNYTYSQPLCQYRSHFSGQETFVAFGLGADAKEWTAGWENPFLFFDPDDDGCSEVVLRVEGKGSLLRAIRYSFDADNDAVGRRTHDYDFSITAVADPGKLIELPADVSERHTLRGLPTQGWMKRDAALQSVAQVEWARQLLTFDELNANTAGEVAADPNERWEGVIALGNESFPQIGGPAVSAFNKRNEQAAAGMLGLYWQPADRRLHLKGAARGWMNVDFDFDGQVDAKYAWKDENGDGLFDARTVDTDADGEPEFRWPMDASAAVPIPIEFKAINERYAASLQEALAGSQAFIDAANAALGRKPADEPAAAFFLDKLDDWMPQTGLGRRIRSTPAGARFYQELVRDRLAAALKKAHGSHASWGRIEASLGAGDDAGAAEIVARELAPDKKPRSPKAFRDSRKRVPIRIDNSAGPLRESWPVTIAVKDLEAGGGALNLDKCVLTAADRRLGWRPVPHGLDEIGGQGRQLSFLADLPAGQVTTYYLYELKDAAPPAWPRRTGTAEDWVPPNIGWESGWGAYRAYWGQFDFFGKRTDQLLYEAIGSRSYHGEVEWGIDALHVGETSGLGGLSLYLGDKAYLVQNPAGKGQVTFTKRRLAGGPVRAAVEIVAGNVVPGKPDLTVRMLCVSYAERQETQVTATLAGAPKDAILGAGLVKLPREQAHTDAKAGLLCSWGWQEEAIGDIGMAVMMPPATVVDVVDLPAERRIRVRPGEGGSLTYWLIGDWRRGRQHPVAPTMENWRTQVTALAGGLNALLPVQAQAAEAIP